MDQGPIGSSDIDCLIADNELAGEQIVLAAEGSDDSRYLDALAGAEGLSYVAMEVRPEVDVQVRPCAGHQEVEAHWSTRRALRDDISDGSAEGDLVGGLPFGCCRERARCRRILGGNLAFRC